MSIAIVSTAYMRQDILDIAIWSWRRAGASKIYVACSTDGDEEFLRRRHVNVIRAPNSPLGAKWNAAFEEAFKDETNHGFVVMGSDDTMNSSYLLGVHAALSEGYDFGGVLDEYTINSRDGSLHHWLGYSGPRKGESIGAGRFFSRKLLGEINCEPFDPTLDRNLDGSMTKRIPAGTKSFVTTLDKFRLGAMQLEIKGDISITSIASMLPNSTRVGLELVDRGLLVRIDDLPRNRPWVCGAMICEHDVDIYPALLSLHSDVDFFAVHIFGEATGIAYEAARAFGAYVVHAEKPLYADKIDFAAARNAVHRTIEGIGGVEWIVWLDSDETYVSIEPLSHAAKVATSKGSNVVALELRASYNNVLQRVGQQRRMYRLGSAFWKYPVHNRLIVEGKTIYLSGSQIATTYLTENLPEKIDRALPGLHKLWEEGADNDDKAHAAFYLARTYLAKRDRVAALQWARAVTSLSDGPEYSEAWVHCAMLSLAVNGPGPAAAICNLGIEKHPMYADLHRARLSIALVQMLHAAQTESVYSLIAQETPLFLDRVADVAKLLRLPLEFK